MIFYPAEDKAWLLDQAKTYHDIRGEGGSGVRPTFEVVIDA